MDEVKEIRRGTLQEQTFYEQVGGEETFRRLVHRFYEGVAEDPILRPMYPEEDLGPGRGAPRAVPDAVLGRSDDVQRQPRPPPPADAARPFTVDRAAHDAWLKHMRDAVDDLGLSEEHEQHAVELPDVRGGLDGEHPRLTTVNARAEPPAEPPADYKVA